MARFDIISKDGSVVRYSGKPRYNGVYLKPSFLEFAEIASPTPISWEVGDYVDYPRTGMRYRLYSVPQASKNARKDSHGRAFTYSHVQFHAATKELEIALFRDLVDADNNIHFSSSSDVSTFENVEGIARRIQACMDDFYPGRWEIRIADFDITDDAEVIKKIGEAKEFALSGGTCLDALSKIYELWQDIGWVYTHEEGKEVIIIGYPNKRIDENTTEAFLYGKGNGLTAIRKNQTNREEFATRLYVYGSERNLPPRYYNGKDILNAESVDIRNLMIPIDSWGKTDGLPDARKAYLENAEAVAKYGVIPKTHYFDSDDAGADIYPSITGMTIGMIRAALEAMGEQDSSYYPSEDAYPDSTQRVDLVRYCDNPTDDGSRGDVALQENNTLYGGKQRTVSIPSGSAKVNIIESELLASHSFTLSEAKPCKVVFNPSISGYVADDGFEKVEVKLSFYDNDSTLSLASATQKTLGVLNDGKWQFNLPSISYDYAKSPRSGFSAYIYLTITVTLASGNDTTAISYVLDPGGITFSLFPILDKTLLIRLNEIGFDINAQASLGKGKAISMKTGMCAGRTFLIESCRHKSASGYWDFTVKRQQDNTLGLIFPNKDYQIAEGDEFVLIDIAMPELYILANSQKLLSEGQELLARASKIQTLYELSVDAKVMAETGRVLREGMFMEITDEDVVDNTTDYILIDTLSIYEDESAIPTYKVSLKERRKVTYKGTPSATSATETESVEEDATSNAEVDVDLSDYYTKEEVNNEIDTLADLLNSMWRIEDNKIVTDMDVLIKANLIVEKDTSSGGEGQDTPSAGLNEEQLQQYLDEHKYVTEDDIAGLIPDVDLSDYYTSEQTDSAISTAIANLINGAPTTLDTLKEIADALAENEDVVDALEEAIGTKANASDLTALTTRVGTAETNITNLTNGKADKATTLAGYGITDAYTKSDLESYKTWWDAVMGLVVKDGNNIRIKTNLIVEGDTSSGGSGSDTPASGTVTGIKVNGTTYEPTAGIVTIPDYPTSLTWSAISGKPSFATVATSGKYSDLSGLPTIPSLDGYATETWVTDKGYITGITKKMVATALGASTGGRYLIDTGGDVSWANVPTSLPASDVYAWAKKSSLALEDVPDLSSKYLSVNGGTIGSGLSNSFPLFISSTNAYTGLAFYTSGGTGYMRFQGGSTWGVTDAGWNNSYTLIHSGNIGSYKAGDSDKLGGYAASVYPSFENQGTVIGFNLHTDYIKLGQGDGHIEFYDGGWYNSAWGKVTAVNGFVGNLSGNADSATKLATARTIWGQSFDGTGNISGNLYLGTGTIRSSKSGTDRVFIDFGSAGDPYIGYGIASAGIDSHLCGNNIYLHYGTSRTNGLILNSSGNVTIGASDLAGTTYKMSVDGKVHIRSTASASMNEGAGSLIVGNGAVLMIDANDIQAKTDGTTAGPLYINDWGGNVILCGQNNGNVLIGTTKDASKLTVSAKYRSALPSLGSLSANSDMAIHYDGDSAGYGMYFSINGYTGASTIQVGRNDGDTSAYNLLLNPLGGNVGIGTSSPAYKLDVSGKFRASGNVILGASSYEDGRLRVVGESGATNVFVVTDYNGYTKFKVQNDGSANFVGVVTMSSTLNVASSIYTNGSLFMNKGGDGLYLTNTGIAFHNSSNAYAADIMYFSRDAITPYQSIIPGTNNVFTLGTSSYQWSHLYAVGATFSGDVTINGNLIVKGDTSSGGAGQSTSVNGPVYISVGALYNMGDAQNVTQATMDSHGLTMTVVNNIMSGLYTKAVDISRGYNDVWSYDGYDTGSYIYIFFRQGDGFDIHNGVSLSYNKSTAKWYVIAGEI